MPSACAWAQDDVVLMASPMAHQTGFMYGLMMPIMLRASAVLQDVWEPKKAIELIRAEGVSFTMASTPFLTDLTKTVAETRHERCRRCKTFLCAGAPIPGPLVEQARKVLGTKIVSAWGMTENGAVTLIKLDDDDELRLHDRRLPAAGRRGQGRRRRRQRDARRRGRQAAGARVLQLRRLPEAAAVEQHRRRRLVRHRRPRAHGRARLHPHQRPQQGRDHPRRREHPGGRDRGAAVPASGRGQVAIVAYPDERLGERACAVVVPKPGQGIDFAAMVEFLKAQKVALQYIPERLIVRDAMPATPSGKIQKFKLRDMVRDGSI